MIRVIGSARCLNCQLVKKKLEKDNIDFTYELLDDLAEDERSTLEKMATSKKLMQMPLILKDGELITIKEV